MIYCQDSAFRLFIDKLKSIGESPEVLKTFNGNRHRLIKSKEKKYYVLFKRDFFSSFETKFPKIYTKYPYLKGKGESINKKYLEFAILYEADYVIFIHPNKIYKISPFLIYKFCNENNLLRRTDKERLYKEKGGKFNRRSEVTYSFPKALLEEF